MSDSSKPTPTGIAPPEAEVRDRLAEFGIASYQIEAIIFFMTVKSFVGSRVLEVGGHDLPPELKFEFLGASKWHCVDITEHGSGDYQKYFPLLESEAGITDLRAARLEHLCTKSAFFNGDVIDLPSAFFNSYDICVSICAFEHIQLLPLAVSKIYSALSFNGSLVSYFGPVWSSFCGHHFWHSDALNFNKLGPVEPHDHLLLSQPEMLRKLLDSSMDLETASSVTDLIFCSKTVNRLLYEDYDSIMRLSDFTGHTIAPYGMRPLRSDTRDALSARFPHYSRFDAYGVKLNAWKLRNHEPER